MKMGRYVKSLGIGEQRTFPEIEFQVDLSRESKMYGFPYENDRIRMSLRRGDCTRSQK